MKYNKIIFNIFIILSNIVLLITFLLRIYQKQKNNNSIIIPINNIILQLIYIILSIIAHIIHNDSNIYNIILFILLFISKIIFLLLSINDNFRIFIYNLFKKFKN